MSVRVRYAPSPTGLQHIGGIRSALFNYFFAKSNNGKFILRVEDTDQTRYSDESLEDLYSTLKWLDIKWDEGPVVGGEYGPYIQSQRTKIYQEYAKKLVDEGKAYYCYCTSKRLDDLREEQEKTKSKLQGYDGHCRTLSEEEKKEAEKNGIKPVIRFKVPREGKTSFDDILMGTVTRKNKDISPDPILLKSDGYPTYHLANVIDDHLMKITHIMRAQEWIPSGALHVLLYEAFGWEKPIYCHLPMVMGKDGQKLSKRHGSTSVRDFKEKGYLPEAMINYVTLVGWAFDGEREFFSKEELEKIFDIKKIHKSPGVFDYKKLEWFNGQYIRMCDDDRLVKLLLPYLEKENIFSTPSTEKQVKALKEALPLIKDRLKVLSDVVPLLSFAFAKEDPKVELSSFVAKKSSLEEELSVLEKELEIFEKYENSWDEEKVEQELKDLSTNLDLKLNTVMQPLRVAITFSTISPPIFGSISLIGVKESIRRIKLAINNIKAGLN